MYEDIIAVYSKDDSSKSSVFDTCNPYQLPEAVKENSQKTPNEVNIRENPEIEGLKD
jgi:hypothetical protein